MKKKKLSGVAFVLSIAMLGSVTVGCNKKDEISSNHKTTPTLLWYAPGDTPQDKAVVINAFNEKLQQKIGANLDLQFIDLGSYNEKMKMMIASNKEFDMCFTSNWTNSFVGNVKKGGFIELSDLIEKEAPKLKTALPDYLYNAATIEGKIYAVPNLQVMFLQTGLMFYKEYVDKYNFDVTSIKNVEDVEPFLETLKQNESGLYPYRLGYNIYPFYISKYEPIPSTADCAILKDGSSMKVVILNQTEEYKHGLEVLHRWFEKGYIRKDINSVMDDEAEVMAGKYAVFQNTYKPGGIAESEARYGKKMVFCPIEQPYLPSDAGASTMTAISRTSKNAESAIKLIEILNTDKEMYNLISFGIEGKHYNKIGENQIEIPDNSTYKQNTAWEFGNQFNAYYQKGQETNIWEETDRLNNEAKKSPIAGFSVNTDPIKTELSQIGTVDKEFEALKKGSEDPAKMYDEYQRKLQQAGQEKVRQEVQNQLDAWLAAKK